MTTRRTEQDARMGQDARTGQEARTDQGTRPGQEVGYNQPYRRAEAEAPAGTRAAWAEPTAEAGGRGMAPSQAPPEVMAGRMSSSDRISGGPIWSGFIISVAVWIFLEIVLVAAGWAQIQASQGSSAQRSGWWWSLGAGLVALFIGGLVSGIGSRWHTPGAGAMQGLTVWALTFVALLVLGAVGAGLAFGAFSDAISIRPGASGQAIQNARDAAGVAVVGLIVTAAVAVIGGILGALMTRLTQGHEKTPTRAASRA